MKRSPRLPDFHQAKTLFYPSHGPVAMLVQTRNGKRSTKPMRFDDPHAALSWCIKHRAGFVYFIVAAPAQN